LIPRGLAAAWLAGALLEFGEVKLPAVEGGCEVEHGRSDETQDRVAEAEPDPSSNEQKADQSNELFGVHDSSLLV
jgi:hypothetical protein